MSNATWRAWAQVMTVVVAVVGAAWGLAWSLSGNFERLGAAVAGNAAAIERVQASVDAGRAAMAENATAIARLAGQYAEHVRRHDDSGQSSALAAAR